MSRDCTNTDLIFPIKLQIMGVEAIHPGGGVELEGQPERDRVQHSMINLEYPHWQSAAAQQMGDDDARMCECRGWGWGAANDTNVSELS